MWLRLRLRMRVLLWGLFLWGLFLVHELKLMVRSGRLSSPTARFPLGDFYARTSQNSVSRKFGESAEGRSREGARRQVESSGDQRKRARIGPENGGVPALRAAQHAGAT